MTFFVIPRVLGQHEDVQLIFKVGLFFYKAVHFFLSHGHEVIIAVGVVQDFLIPFYRMGDVLILAERFDKGHERRMFLRQLLPFFLTGNDRRVADLLFQVHEFILHGLYFIHK